MKKAVFLLLCAALFASLTAVPAAAETDLSACSISNGTVQAARFEDVTAPCSGVLLPFDLSAGDAAEPGAVLFEMMTTRVTAPEDGIVRHVFVEAGDSADAAMATYGAVMAIEPARLERMHASYRTAPSDDEDCLHVHVGQPLWFKYDGVYGTGAVIATSGSSYEVEILTGEYDIGEALSLYKNESYDYHNRVGEGIVYKRDDVTVAGSGVVAGVLVKPGDFVSKGETLFTLLPADADVGAVPAVTAGTSGVVSAVTAVSGQQVWKGQMLARISRADSLEIVADVDEMDLNGLRVGDRVPVTLDTDEAEILTGTVTEISGLGVTRQNAAYYTVHLTVEKDGLMLGQSASVYLPGA